MSARQNLMLFFVLLCVGMGIALLLTPGEVLISREAVIRTGIARDLLDGLTRGRQGFIGSARWAPLPTLVVVPMLKLTQLDSTALPMQLQAAAAAALLAVFLNAWFAQCGLHLGWRLAAVGPYFLSAWILRPIAIGTSEPLFVFLTVATVCFLVRWLERERLRDLAYMGVSLSIVVLVRYQAIVLVIPVAAAVTAHLLLRHKGGSYAEATFTIALVPVAYAVALWLAANWLIMGESKFFLRALGSGIGWNSETTSAGFNEWLHALRHAWAPLLLEGCEWKALVPPMALACLAWILGKVSGTAGWTSREALRVSRALPGAQRSPGSPGRARFALAGMPVALAALGLTLVTGYEHLAADTSYPDAELRSVVRYIRAHHRDGALVYSGYRGYELTRELPHGSPVSLVHKLSMYMDDVLRDTRGWELVILTPRPREVHRYEDVLLKYPGAFEEGFRFGLFEKSWPNWRLWQVIRVDREVPRPAPPRRAPVGPPPAATRASVDTP